MAKKQSYLSIIKIAQAMNKRIEAGLKRIDRARRGEALLNPEMEHIEDRKTYLALKSAIIQAQCGFYQKKLT